MVASIYGMNSYSNLFASPYNNTQVSPLANLLYGSISSNLYAQTVAVKLQSNVSTFMTSLSRSSYDLKTSAKSLASTGPDSSFNKKAVSSYDSNAVTGIAASNADSKAYTISVSKLAVAQVNTGTALNTKDKSTLASGVNTVALKVGTTTKNVSFTIDEKDTNQSSLNKMASAINYAKTGVTASVLTDTKTGTSTLKLTADKTGTGNEISLTDVNGNATAASGANNVATHTQDAVYKLDGKQYTSKSNTISTENDKVKFTLYQADGKDIKLTVGRDTKAIGDDIKDLVKSYNSMINLANSNSSNSTGAVKLKADLENIIKSKIGALANIGITQKDDGTLAVDSKKLSDAVANDISGVKNAIGGHSGMAEKLYSNAIQVQTSPLQYAQQLDIGNIVGAFGSNIFQSNSYTSWQNIYSGMVVDTLF